MLVEPLNLAEYCHQSDVFLVLMGTPRVHKINHQNRFVGTQCPRRITKADVQIDGSRIDVELPPSRISVSLWCHHNHRMVGPLRTCPARDRQICASSTTDLAIEKSSEVVEGLWLRRQDRPHHTELIAVRISHDDPRILRLTDILPCRSEHL